jgi:hypothetical protein
MSHIVVAATKITVPVNQPAHLAAAKSLLAQAVQLAAGQHRDGRTADHYLDWYNTPQRDCELSIFTYEVHRGMGLVVEPTTGQLKFIGDFYGVQPHVDRLQAEIVQLYTTLAIKQSLEQLGFVTTAGEGEAGRVILKGVTYA